jgi:undecaprenyl-diphosphatase
MLGPTAVIGLLARKAVRENLGEPSTITAGLVAGSVAMLATAGRPGGRQAKNATVLDGIAIGISQSAGLWPGFSRSGAATVAGRLRGFDGGEAARLARTGLVTTSLAASALQIAEAARGGLEDNDLPAVAAGAGTAFLSALVARPLATRLERTGNIVPWALWRLGLAAVALLRIRSLGEDAKT